MSDFDVVIIGGGAVGAATQFFLAKQGITNTLLLEKKESFAKGATGCWGSLIRVFSINAETTREAVETVPYYFRFKEETGFDCGIKKTGSLYFFSGVHFERISNAVKLLNQTRGTDLKILDSRIGGARFPHFQWLEGDFAVYEQMAGYACPSLTTEGWINSAIIKGAQAKCSAGVKKFVTEDGKVTSVITESGDEYRAKIFILTTGPWIKQISDQLDLGLPIFPMAIQVNRFGGLENESDHPIFLDFDQISFGRSLNGSLYGGFCKEGIASMTSFKQPLNLADASEAKRRLSKRLSWLRTATLEGGVRAIEAYTYDLKAYINFTDKLPNLLVGGGWSCSGFTLAPTYGKKLATLTQNKLEETKLWKNPASALLEQDQRPLH
jgi:glycine/D-amino acid oxidase-like deaminating enzyme